MEDLSGQQFGVYQLIDRLGVGNYGAVYRAEHIHHKTIVAIKILHTELDADSFASFLSEARAFQLEHPNIVRIKDFGVEDNRPFLVMNYTPNGNLRQRHAHGTKLPWTTVVMYARQIADALQCVHDEGIVHRDIKPQNLLVGPNNEILLGDFGIATTSYTWNPRLIQVIQGTPLYMAPEQIDGHAVRESDQYALGIVMYEWITGKTPFSGTLDEVVVQHHMAKPQPPRSAAPALLPQAEAVILKMLEKDPRNRFASMREFVAALELLQKPRPVPPTMKPAIYQGHADGVRTVAWSPDGRYIASAGRDMTVQVWEVTTGACIYTYHGHIDEIWSVAWSPDSRSIVSAGSDNAVEVWEATSGYDGTTYDKHSDIVRAVSWSPNSTYITSAGDDSYVRVWKATDASTVGTFHRTNNSISTLAWSPDGTRIALGGEDFIVYIWDVFADSYPLLCQGHKDRITAVTWSPDGSCIASSSDDGTVCVWQTRTGQKLYMYTGHSHEVSTVAWSPHEHRLASGSWDNTVHVWSIDNLEPPYIYRGHTRWVNALSWSPDGQLIVSGSWDKTAHVWAPQ